MKKVLHLINKYLGTAIMFLIPVIMLVVFETTDKYVFKRDIQLFNLHYWINILEIVLGVVFAIICIEIQQNREDKNKYYIRTRGFVGNGLIWWRPGSAGYTSDIEQAGKYTYDEAYSICKSSYGDALAYKCSTIDNLEDHALTLQVHADYAPKPDIGTRFGEEIE